MAQIQSVTQTEPDPDQPPLRVTVGRNDQGQYECRIELGGMNPVVAAALLTEATASILRATAGGPSFVVLPLLDQLARAFWDGAPPYLVPPPVDQDQTPTPCPDCGEIHG